MKKFSKLLCGVMTAALLCGCGSTTAPAEDNASTDKAEEAVTVESETAETSDAVTDEEGLSYAGITLGEDYTDLEVTISLLNNRTDLDNETYGGTTWREYLAAFNEEYPGIKVELTTDTNYAETAMTHLQSGDYETVMMIPAVDKADLSTYFMSYGDLATMETQINYATNKEYNGQVYGVPITATAQGVVYNKKVFADAGVTELPKTPEEFLAALKAIKDNDPSIIPLYTNYAAGWTMGAWDDYIGISATGDVTYTNQKLLHTENPFKDYGDNTHPYAIYKILYDAVAQGLTEEDYTTTDWEGCKGMINNGQIGCMVLGSWSYPQMEAAGENAENIGYMPFPVSVDGKQYALCGPDYCFGINVNATDDEKAGAMVFVKWMTEKSNYSYNEDGLPIAKSKTETKLVFDGVELLEEVPAVAGEEDLLNELNAESELNIRNAGDTKVQQIIEHASMQDMTFDEIMDDWNKRWSDAQETLGVSVDAE
ncbi:MAG: extracellular solute-binding protein [Acetatifactor sp.]|nr:extracellular solute-binding protein [Acetatifactor sp.]